MFFKLNLYCFLRSGRLKGGLSSHSLRNDSLLTTMLIGFYLRTQFLIPPY